MNLSSPAAVGTLLRRHGLRPQRRLGQNFLVDGNTLTRIVDAAGIFPGDGVLEVGTGLGVLTQALAERVGGSGRVLTIEIDTHLIPVLEETLADISQVTLLNTDALALDFSSMLPEHGMTAPVRVVANIPYQITSPLIAKFLEAGSVFSPIVLLVQKEVAERLVAKPGTSEYGAFSVFVQFHARVELVGPVPKTCFFPPPDVTSAILRLTPWETRPVSVRDEPLLFSIVKAAFGQRRKTLLNALSNDPGLGWTKEQASDALVQAGIDPNRRGETLSIAEFESLASRAVPLSRGTV